jgi:hypothetical protein
MKGQSHKSHTRDMEGDNEQRRKAGRKARDEGRLPSEVGATLGASKQLKQVKRDASHDDRLATEAEGKRGAGTGGKPRPGNREIDPKRGEGWR